MQKVSTSCLGPCAETGSPVHFGGQLGPIDAGVCRNLWVAVEELNLYKLSAKHVLLYIHAMAAWLESSGTRNSGPSTA